MIITPAYKLNKELMRLFQNLVIKKLPDGNVEATHVNWLITVLLTDFEKKIIYVYDESFAETLETFANIKDLECTVVLDML